MREWISLAPIQQIGQSRAEIRSWVRVVRVVYDGGWNKIIKIKKTNYITASAHTLFSGNTSALIATELAMLLFHKHPENNLRTESWEESAKKTIAGYKQDPNFHFEKFDPLNIILHS